MFSCEGPGFKRHCGAKQGWLHGHLWDMKRRDGQPVAVQTHASFPTPSASVFPSTLVSRDHLTVCTHTHRVLFCSVVTLTPVRLAQASVLTQANCCNDSTSLETILVDWVGFSLVAQILVHKEQIRNHQVLHDLGQKQAGLPLGRHNPSHQAPWCRRQLEITNSSMGQGRGKGRATA